MRQTGETVQQNEQPIITLGGADDNVLACSFLKDGEPQSGEWCAPLTYAPSGDARVATLMGRVAASQGWQTSTASAGDSGAPAGCSTGECLVGFASRDEWLAWLSNNRGRAAAAIFFTPGSTLNTTFEVRVDGADWYRDKGRDLQFGWSPRGSSDGSDGDCSGSCNQVGETWVRARHLAVQRAVQAALVGVALGSAPSAPALELSLKNYPSISTVDPDTLGIASQLQTLFLFIPLALPMLLLLNQVVSEKTSRMLGTLSPEHALLRCAVSLRCVTGASLRQARCARSG